MSRADPISPPPASAGNLPDGARPQVAPVATVLRKEDWRYADRSVLTACAPIALDTWQNLTIPADTQQSKLIGAVGTAGDSIYGEGAHIERLKIHIAAGGRLDCFALLAEDCYRRLELDVTLAQGAHFEFAALTIGGGKHTRECVTHLHHKMPGASSNQRVRAVHWGQATGNFLGTIAVARDAQKSNAAQDYRALLLEKGARAHSRPALEILADDVKCAHGVAIGTLDEQAGFYLATRGLPPSAVRMLLVRGFIADIFDEIADTACRTAMLDHALEILSGAAL